MLNKLLAVIFGVQPVKTVDTALLAFTNALDDLREVAQNHEASIENFKYQIEAISDSKASAEKEKVRAEKVIEQIEAIIS